LLVHAHAVGEGVVAPDRDQRLDAQPLEHPQHVRRAVRRAGLRVVLELALEELRHHLRLHAAGIRARGVQVGAAVAVDRADVRAREAPEAIGVLLVGAVEVEVEEAAPTTRDADHLDAGLLGAVDDRLDAGVEPGDVTPAGQNSDPHSHLSLHTVGVGAFAHFRLLLAALYTERKPKVRGRSRSRRAPRLPY